MECGWPSCLIKIKAVFLRWSKFVNNPKCLTDGGRLQDHAHWIDSVYFRLVQLSVKSINNRLLSFCEKTILRCGNSERSFQVTYSCWACGKTLYVSLASECV